MSALGYACCAPSVDVDDARVWTACCVRIDRSAEPIGITLREPCRRCRGRVGRVEIRNGQRPTWCARCGTYAYLALRTEVEGSAA